MNRHERRKMESLAEEVAIHPDCEHDFLKDTQGALIHCTKCNDAYTLAHQWKGFPWRAEE